MVRGTGRVLGVGVRVGAQGVGAQGTGMGTGTGGCGCGGEAGDRGRVRVGLVRSGANTDGPRQGPRVRVGLAGGRGGKLTRTSAGQLGIRRKGGGVTWLGLGENGRVRVKRRVRGRAKVGIGEQGQGSRVRDWSGTQD